MSYSAIATPVEEAKAVMVEVTAPSTLAAGYSFQAVYNGITFPVTVPEGGVKEGQTFMAPLVYPEAGESTPLGGGASGRWKDGIFDCFKFGPCHPSVLNACFFPQILMAQVLVRTKLNWLGSPAPESEGPKTFKTVLAILICFWFLRWLLSPDDEDEQDEAETQHPVLLWLVTWTFGLYALIVLTRLRQKVRAQYAIRETQFEGCEDLCCAFWCGCCTVSQLARQTADYDQDSGMCCSIDGLPKLEDTEVIV